MCGTDQRELELLLSLAWFMINPPLIGGLLKCWCLLSTIHPCLWSWELKQWSQKQFWVWSDQEQILNSQQKKKWWKVFKKKKNKRETRVRSNFYQNPRKVIIYEVVWAGQWKLWAVSARLWKTWDGCLVLFSIKFQKILSPLFHWIPKDFISFSIEFQKINSLFFH